MSMRLHLAAPEHVTRRLPAQLLCSLLGSLPAHMGVLRPLRVTSDSLFAASHQMLLGHISQLCRLTAA